MHRYSVHDEAALRVFEWAAQHRRAVFVQCGVLSVGVPGKLALPSLFDMRYSNPLVLHGMAQRYPSVPIIVPHLGAGYLREWLMLADLCTNVYLDTSSSNHWMRYEEVHHQETRGGLRHVFRRALDVAGLSAAAVPGQIRRSFPRGWHRRRHFRGTGSRVV